MLLRVKAVNVLPSVALVKYHIFHVIRINIQSARLSIYKNDNGKTPDQLLAERS